MISGQTFKNRVVTFAAVGDRAVFRFGQRLPYRIRSGSKPPSSTGRQEAGSVLWS